MIHSGEIPSCSKVKTGVVRPSTQVRVSSSAIRISMAGEARWIAAENAAKRFEQQRTELLRTALLQLEKDDLAELAVRDIAALLSFLATLYPSWRAARTRPAWRSPTFTVGRANDGASMRPADELPSMTWAWRRQLKKSRRPR